MTVSSKCMEYTIVARSIRALLSMNDLISKAVSHRKNLSGRYAYLCRRVN